MKKDRVLKNVDKHRFTLKERQLYQDHVFYHLSIPELSDKFKLTERKVLEIIKKINQENIKVASGTDIRETIESRKREIEESIKMLRKDQKRLRSDDKIISASNLEVIIEQCVQRLNWLTGVVSFVDRQTKIDTEEPIEITIKRKFDINKVENNGNLST